MAQRHTVEIMVWIYMTAHSIDALAMGYEPPRRWQATATRSDGSERTYRNVTMPSMQRVLELGHQLMAAPPYVEPWPDGPETQE